MDSQKGSNTARRGRGRPRKQIFGVREPCDAPVIELTSSSDEEESPPRPLPRKIPLKPVSAPSKPPILGKRTSILKSPPKSSPEPSKVDSDKIKPKKLTDTETLLSILESNDDDDLEGLRDVIKETAKALSANDETPLEKPKDNLFKSIEDELRYLHQADENSSDLIQSESSPPGKILPKKISGAKRDSVEIVDEIICQAESAKLRPEMVNRDSKNKESSGEVSRSDFDAALRRLKGDKRPFRGEELVKKPIVEKIKVSTGEKMKVLSPSEINLPPEVLQAIKKRANLGRIEKIVEKTDVNKKSKYIVIFNRGSSAPKKKGSIEDEIEELLKSLPEKTPASKKPKLDTPVTKSKLTKLPDATSVLRNRYSKTYDVLTPPKRVFGQSILKKPDPKESKSKFVTELRDTAMKGKLLKVPAGIKDSEKFVETSKTGAEEKSQREEPVRFTESPLAPEPSLPWDHRADDGIEKYFKVTERVVEHHDSLDSESEYDEPEMFSHFKDVHGTLGKASDKISVLNIADTIAREFPGWATEPLLGSDTICLLRTGSDHRGSTAIKKQIKIDSDYNVSVVVNNSSIPEYEGMYDSFDNIKQLVREIDQL